MDKGVLTKFTFGFLMAQLFPGAITVLSISIPFVAAGENPPDDIATLFETVCSRWFTKTTNTIIFLFMAVGIGMFFHGLHWTVLAWLENKKKPAEDLSARDSFWHNRLIIVQVLISPIKMILELLWPLSAPSVEKLVMEENAPYINSKNMPQFNFLQDHYLHFGQFFAHMAYALLCAIVCSIITWSFLGFTYIHLLLTVIIYLATSSFFLIGRIQLGSLFSSEIKLRED